VRSVCVFVCVLVCVAPVDCSKVFANGGGVSSRVDVRTSTVQGRRENQAVNVQRSGHGQWASESTHHKR
jgi:hypothetical protein